MENTEGNGGPQVDCFDERESPGMKRELKEIGPQADGGREREVIHTLSIKIGVHQAEASSGN